MLVAGDGLICAGGGKGIYCIISRDDYVMVVIGWTCYVENYWPGGWRSEVDPSVLLTTYLFSRFYRVCCYCDERID